MRKTIKGLERELEYCQEYKDKYFRLQSEYKDKFERRYDNILENEKSLYQANYDLINIIRWLINPDSVVPLVIKQGEIPVNPEDGRQLINRNRV